MMSQTAVEALVTDLFEALNSGDPGQVGALYTADYRGNDVGQAGGVSGREAVVRSYSRLIAAFPDARFEGESLVSGERVALIWTMRGTHRGPFLNVPATGREVEIRGVSVLAIANGQFASGTRIWDVAGFLRQVRLIPELPE